MIAQQLTEQLGKPFNVENRAGAGGAIGAEFVAKSSPNGYTLMLMDTSTAILAGLRKSLPFDVARDFTPISQITAIPNVLVVPSSLGATTLKEFIALAQAKPGRINYGSAGVGSSNHLWPALFNKAATVDITHVPFKGASEVTTAMLTGDVQMQITAIPAVLTLVNSGKLRALAVTTTERRRSPAMPDVPSMAEAGVAGMAIYAWHGLAGPAGIPKDIAGKLHVEVARAITVPSVKEKFTTEYGADLVGSSPDDFSNHVRIELRRLAEVIKTAGITPE